MAFDYPPAVSQPRRLLAHTTYLITRRTDLRHMLLRPDPVMTQIIVYLLAVIAKRTGFRVHAVCAMSTHIHLVVTDVECKLPEFLQAFHLLIARCTMAHRRWGAPVWDKSPTSVVRLETRAAVVEKIAYVLANPVAAGLVEHAHEWPGAKVLASELGRAELAARRPNVYLNPNNWPDEATLPIVLPPGVEPTEADSFRKQVAAELESLEAQARGELQERGGRWLGADRARRVRPTARATSVEPKIDRNPTFAVGRNHGEEWRNAAAAVRAFRAAYRHALDRWCEGLRDVVFPAGTWLMRVLHGAVVASATAPP
jgi:REP element-mobilizing transposase RayT